MNNKNESRRVKMTKNLLNNSFLDCVSEKPLEKVTVTEICERADVNRSTLEKRREFQVLLSGNLDLSLLKDIIFSLWDAVFPPEDGADIDDVEQRFRYLYCSSGCISLIFQWVTSEDMNQLDSDHLARMLVDFTRNNYKLAKTPPPMMDF